MRKLFTIIGGIVSMTAPRSVFAIDATDYAAGTGLNTTATEAFGTTWVGSNTSLSTFIGKNIIQPIFGLVGLGFFCLAVYAGVLWMTAQGDSKKVDKAKDILVSATVGMVIIVSAYVLTNAILSAVTSGSVT